MVVCTQADVNEILLLFLFLFLFLRSSFAVPWIYLVIRRKGRQKTEAGRSGGQQILESERRVSKMDKDWECIFWGGIRKICPSAINPI